MTGRTLPVTAVMLVLASCADKKPSLVANDLFLAASCPRHVPDACSLSADEAAVVTVEYCRAPGITEPKATLDLVAKASAGVWEHPDADDPRTFKASLAKERCVYPRLKLGNTVTTVAIDAELLGFHQPLRITLSPASLRDIELSAAPPTIDPKAQPNAIAIEALVRSERGLPTSGTAIRLEVAATDPPGAYATITPSDSRVDANGLAKATLVVTSAAASVTVRATATGPIIAGAAAPNAVTKDLVVVALPP